MAATVYQKDNANYSDKVHMLAREQVYPKLFGADAANITYEADTLVGQSPLGDMLDGEMGIDRIARVSVKGLTGVLSFTVQERFRRPSYAMHRDITVTEWNHASGLPSELYKIQAQVFLYGYADKEQDPTWITEAIAINTTSLLMAIVQCSVKYGTERNKKQQTFLTIPFAELESNNLVLWRNKKFTSPEDTAQYMRERMMGRTPEWNRQFLSALNRMVDA
jgi:hypothetical protein